MLISPVRLRLFANMIHRRLFRSPALVAAIFIFALADFCVAQQLTFTPYKTSGIYAVGEKVGWTVSKVQGAPVDNYTYAIKKNNQVVIKTGILDLSTGRPSIEVTLDEPAMVYVGISSPGGETFAVGAAVAPERLQPSALRPVDFDTFWKSKIKMLRAIPENTILTPSDSGLPDVDYATIKMDHINGTHVYGQLAKPKRKGKFPALIIFQWASPPYPLQKQWVTDHAAKGWLVLNIEPHDVLIDQPPSYYSSLPQELKTTSRLGKTTGTEIIFYKCIWPTSGLLTTWLSDLIGTERHWS